MSHWMTFGGQAMIAVLLGLAWLLFAGEKRPACRLALAAALAVLASAILLGFTRGVWLATAAGALYLLWCWRPRYAALLPLIAAAALLAGPASLRQRALSMVNPQDQLDSNSHRAVCYRAGIAMAAAHPWLGIGPELVGPDLMNHLPADVRPPLPDGWYAHLHSIYIHYAAERGIPAALVLMWLLIKMLSDFIKALRKQAAEPCPRRAWLHGAVAVILAILIEGFFELNLGDSEVLAMFLIVVGSAYAFLYPPPAEAADAR
jgi:putative inorganic carbon (hco3(-)) transporter